MLTDTQIERYSRQIILPQVGGRGQENLLSASVAVVDPDNGGTVARYLAAAGVGSLTVVGGSIERGGGSMATRIEDIEALNPDCRIRRLSMPRDCAAGMELVRSNAVVVIAAQRHGAVETTRWLNAACVSSRKPLLWAGIARSVGCVTVLAGGRAVAPCYDCLPPPLASMPDNTQLPASLSAVLRGFLGTVQATECIKLLLGLDSELVGRVVTFDWHGMAVRETSVARDPQCATCAAQQSSSLGIPRG